MSAGFRRIESSCRIPPGLAGADATRCGVGKRIAHDLSVVLSTKSWAEGHPLGVPTTKGASCSDTPACRLHEAPLVTLTREPPAPARGRHAHLERIEGCAALAAIVGKPLHSILRLRTK